MTIRLFSRTGRVVPVVASTVVAMVVAALALAAMPSAAQASRAPANPYGGSWHPDHAKYAVSNPVPLTVPMPDGVKLAGEAFYPISRRTGHRAPGRFPVILELTPYPLSQDHKLYEFPAYGYIGVVVNERGTWSSGGQRHNYAPQEGRDGATVIRWLAAHLRQSNGRFGMTGCSSPGKAQLLTAEYIGRHSPLKAIAPAAAPQEGGTEDLLREAALVNGVPGPTSLLIGEGMVALEGGSRPVPQYPEQAASWQSGGPWAYDRPTTYGGVPYPAGKVVRNGIAALLWSGTRDIVPNGTMAMYVALQNSYRGRDWRLPMSASQQPTGRYQVVMNDQPHCTRQDVTLLLRWYDTWLKGMPTGIAHTPTPIHFLEQPTMRWINASRYPFTNDYRSIYLSAGRGLVRRHERAGTASLEFGPASAPDGNVVFTTRPFRRSTDIAGLSSATVYSSTSGRNLHLVATLQDVGPNGRVTNVSDGNVVGSLGSETGSGPNRLQVWRDRYGTVIKPFYRMGKDRYLRPHKIYRFDIRIGTTIWRVLPGHSLRLQLATQVQQLLCKTLLGHEPCYFTQPQLRTLPGTYRLYFGPRHPSRLNLPLVRPSSLATARSGRTPTSGGYVQPLDWG